MVAATQTAEDDDEQMGPPSGEQNEESASHHEQIRSDLEWPTNDLFSSMTYSYMSRILEKGRKQFKNGDPLRTDDLFRVPDDMKADTLVSAFWELHKVSGSLHKALWGLVHRPYIQAGVWEFVSACSRVSLPILLQQLLVTIQEHPGENIIDKALPFAALMTLAFLTAAIAQNRVVYLATKSGIMVRAALTSAIYEHSLKLSPRGRDKLSTGEITNLVAVDTQKLFDVMLEGHNIWSCPMLVVVVSVMLAVMIGPSVVIGVLVLILFLPVVQMFVKRMLDMRKKRSELADNRVDIIASALQGILVIKLNHQEQKVQDRVNEIRSKEVNILKKELEMWSLVITSAVSSPLVATAVSFVLYVLISEANILTPAKAFTGLLLFSILRFPINLTARLVGKMAQAVDALRRVESFLERESRRKTNNYATHSDPTKQSPSLVQIQGASFVADSKSDDSLVNESQIFESFCSVRDSSRELEERKPDTFTLQKINLSLNRSEVLAIVGRVGSGKSLLLKAILGEIAATSDTDTFEVNGIISYAPQTPFILNASLRENILFGSKFHHNWYKKVLRGCSLERDIDQLGNAGDLTQIGDRGMTLSGGQKQRIALARAIYASPDVALLDDVFSALDANTSREVFEAMFGQNGAGLFANSGTIMVTHAIHLLPRVDKIMVMADGQPVFYGTWEDLKSKKAEEGFNLFLDGLGEDNVSDTITDTLESPWNCRNRGSNDAFVMATEEREYGIATAKTWMRWFHHAGGFWFIGTQAILIIFERIFYISSDWWLSIWSDAAYESTSVFGFELKPQSSGRDAQLVFVSVYSFVIFLSIIAALLRSQWACKWYIHGTESCIEQYSYYIYLTHLVRGGALCAASMFSFMIESVVRAPMSYFDTTSLGRIVNRFTFDIEVLDVELSVSMAGIIMSSSWLLSSVVVMVAVLPFAVVGLAPVLLAYFVIQNHYRMSGPDLQRLDAQSRGPIQSTLSEGLEGSACIRAFRTEDAFATKFRVLVDTNSSAMLNFVACQRWLSLRVETLGAVMNTTVTFIIVCLNDRLDLDPGKAGLVILWSVIFSTALNFFFVRLSETEARVTSIERIHETSSLTSEAPWETVPSKSLLTTWPSKGEVVFENVSLRYRVGLDLALDRVSFRIKPLSRTGIVGRTGSGKSSLAAALFRIVEIESGRITLDSVDLSTLGLADVRGRRHCMRMIPQDPFLFAGTLRECVDPFESFSDSQVYDALVAVRFKGTDKGTRILNDIVEEGGRNFSVGERQLLCLARAIVEEPRVLVLDEATASVDTETDRFVQEMIRTRFQNTTLLTIAHRLQTIMDYDTIIVMDDGHCVELGSPKDLVNNGGPFQSLVDATGPEGSRELRNIAFGL